jgi:hypothetical protein
MPSVTTTETYTAPAERPVIKAIVEIMREVGAVEKKGRNDFHKYDYATAADVAHALQKRMAEAGLVIIPHQRAMAFVGDGQAMCIEFEFTVMHVSGDKLDEAPVFSGMARARDSKGGFDDKAANKCLTAASKYFVLNLFRIPTGDYHDADADAISPPAKANGNGAAKAPLGEQAMPPAELEAHMIRTAESLGTVAKVDNYAKLHRPAYDSLPEDGQKRVKAAFDKRRAELEATPEGKAA